MDTDDRGFKRTDEFGRTENERTSRRRRFEEFADLEEKEAEVFRKEEVAAQTQGPEAERGGGVESMVELGEKGVEIGESHGRHQHGVGRRSAGAGGERGEIEPEWSGQGGARKDHDTGSEPGAGGGAIGVVTQPGGGGGETYGEVAPGMEGEVWAAGVGGRAVREDGFEALAGRSQAAETGKMKPAAERKRDGGAAATIEGADDLAGRWKPEADIACLRRGGRAERGGGNAGADGEAGAESARGGEDRGKIGTGESGG